MSAELEDDMSFADWSAHLDSLSADSNHCWLPAYGLQPPVDQGPTPQQFLFLETIQEETSDDLRSESSRSSHAGWPESDSDAGSVIHIAATYHGDQDLNAANGPSSWSGSERDLAVPPKRRRQDDWGPPGQTVALSRSSSLIAFESLERRLSEEEEALGAGGLGAFRTTATLRPFDWADSRSPSASASDSSDDESEDSDDSLMQSFNSSRGSFRSSAGSERLRAFRSLDSLSALGTLSGGSANSGAAHLSRPCQDLSLSSAADEDGAPAADGDAYPAATGRKERSHSLSPKASLRSLLDATYSLSDHEDAPADHDHLDSTYSLGERGRLDATFGLSDHGDLDATYCLSDHGHLDHTAGMTRGDFLDEPDLEDSASSHPSSSSSSSSGSCTEHEDVLAKPASTASETTSGSTRTVRSAENLSEDSGFGEHASYLATPTGKRLTVCPILEDDTVDNDASSCYSACSSSSSSNSSSGGGGGRKQKDVEVNWGAGDAKFSAGWHRSAPDLLVCGALSAVAEELADGRDGSHPGWSTGAHGYGLAPLDGPTMASTPDLNKPALIKTDKGLGNALSASSASQGKGVHFCDVVAEVSWRDSYSDVDDDDEDDVDETDGADHDEDDDEDDHEEDLEEEVQAVAYKLQVGSVTVDKPAAHAAPAGRAPPAEPHSPPSSPPRAPPRAPPRSPPAPPPTAVSQPAAPAPAPAQPRQPRSVTSMAAPLTQPAASPSPLASPTASPKKTSRFGDFFQRFSLRRLSGRHHDHASKKLSRSASAPSSPPPSLNKGTNTHLQQLQHEDVRIIPLHPTAEELEAERREAERRTATLATKPPLPPSVPPRGPRGVGRAAPGPAPGHAHAPRDVTAAAAAAAVTAAVAWRSSSSMAGLLETDLDADLPAPAPGPPAGKARSLLDVSGYASGYASAPQGARGPHGPRVPSPSGLLDAQDPASRAKSMEFLLDRHNQEAVKPPENALQGLQNRVLSEHELRVQRSLQQLNVPDWYKNSARPAEGFLLKRGSADAGGQPGTGRVRSAGGWPGLGVKTTSLSSLRSPTTAVRLGSSPSPPPAAFTRWSSSRLAGSCNATPSTSPCGSARSSFNHRQPYLGWRSQERLSGTPRTPAERLAQGLLEQREQQRLQQRLRPNGDSSQAQSSSPNLSDVRSSIKEVTSAIVHYVSAANGPGSSSDVRVGAPAASNSDLRGGHPSASTGSTPRVCWIESSFVGSRPIEQPQTPDESVVSTSPLQLSHQDLYLDLKDLKQRPSPLGHGHGPHNGPHQNHAFPDEIDTHQDSDSSEHTLKRTPSKRDTAFIRKRNRRNLNKKKKGSKTWRTKSKLKVVSLEVLFGIGVCML